MSGYSRFRYNLFRSDQRTNITFTVPMVER
jgi:hypothetical protein